MTANLEVCPVEDAIFSKEDCEAAATALGLAPPPSMPEWVAGVDTNTPRGCSYRATHQTIPLRYRGRSTLTLGWTYGQHNYQQLCQVGARGTTFIDPDYDTRGLHADCAHTIDVDYPSFDDTAQSCLALALDETANPECVAEDGVLGGTRKAIQFRKKLVFPYAQCLCAKKCDPLVGGTDVWSDVPLASKHSNTGMYFSADFSSLVVASPPPASPALHALNSFAYKNTLIVNEGTARNVYFDATSGLQVGDAVRLWRLNAHVAPITRLSPMRACVSGRLPPNVRVGVHHGAHGAQHRGIRRRAPRRRGWAAVCDRDAPRRRRRRRRRPRLLRVHRIRDAVVAPPRAHPKAAATPHGRHAVRAQE